MCIANSWCVTIYVYGVSTFVDHIYIIVYGQINYLPKSPLDPTLL